MANLYSYQKLSRFLGGKPFGSGVLGDATVSADPNTRATAIGTSGTNSITLGSTILSNNDVFLLHQTRGSGAGQWEFNRVLSGGGTTAITTFLPINNSYSCTGSDAAQIVKVPMYHDLTLGTLSPSSWNGSTGGVLVLAANGTITVSGVVTTNGGNASGYSGATGGGFYGGDGFYQPSAGHGSYCGEGTSGPKNNLNNAPNGNGAGGGYVGADSAGGGGGNATAGSQGAWNVGGNGGYGGYASGSDDLVTITFGGGGGSGCSDDSYGGGGGAGGGIIFLVGKNITVTGNLKVNGGNGSGYTGDPWYSQACGGGGAGGSIILVTQTAVLGTNLITASAGAGGSQQYAQTGGSGSAGRIAVHYYRTITGTTSPSYTGVLDPTLRESSKMAQMMG